LCSLHGEWPAFNRGRGGVQGCAGAIL
jgi:hypothetical protein